MITVRLTTEAETVLDEYDIPEDNRLGLKAIQNIIEMSRLYDRSEKEVHP